jgi:hypothetical protein
MKKLIVLIIGVVVLIVLAVIAWQFVDVDSGDWNSTDESQLAPTEDPLDVTMDLYGPWLAGLQATSTEFNKAELLTMAPLTADLRTKLLSLTEDTQLAVDPVLCQAVLPERIGTKSVFVTDTESQVMVIPRGTKVPEQALVTLIAVDGEWVINDIVCSRGEIAPELEYTFEREGNLLKQSLLPPLNNEQWHLIYSRDGVAGNAIPLLFNETSVCLSPDGSQQVCVPDQLTEAAAVQLQGAMQEAGVLVERMQLQ